MNLAEAALKRTRFTIAAAVALVLAGIGVLLGFPATEEPSVAFRSATVEAYLPGAPTDRIEDLVARPLEERIRTIAEVKTIETTVRSFGAFITVTLRENTPPERVAQVWQQLRARTADVAPTLPSGIIGPIVNDTWGRVSVMTMALTGAGYDAGQLHQFARESRLRLQTVSGVENVALFGVREDQVFVEIDPGRLAGAGVGIDGIAQALASRNVVAPSGEVEVSGRSLALQPVGELNTAADVGAVQIPLPSGGAVPLQSLAEVRRGPQDPPISAAVFNGAPAVVISISMQPGQNVGALATALEAKVAEISKDLPAGMSLNLITNQAEVVNYDIQKVGKIFLETVVIVVAVVVLFLGWRAGLVTGVIVPLTVLGTLLAMRMLEIELHQVSIAAIIIALGLFVDNGIVIVEDYQRRVLEGESREDAAKNAGATMAAPLLTSSLAIIFAFTPLVAGVNETSEYMRSLAIVLAITLMLSLVLGLTIIAVLSVFFIKPSAEQHEKEERDLISKVRRWYGKKCVTIVTHPRLVIGTMAGLLVAALVGTSFIPKGLLPPSERPQLQMPIELASNASSRQTLAVAEAISNRLKDRKLHPDIESNVIYVGDSGPRFVLGLNPPTPALHRAYAIVNVRRGADLDEVAAKLRKDISEAFPQARIEPKRFALGKSEAGLAEFRISGPDRAVLAAAAGRFEAAIRAEGISDVRDNLEGVIPRLAIDIDHSRSHEVGVSAEAVARTLDATYSGAIATVLRNGEIQTPVVVRAIERFRMSPESIGSIPLAGTGGIVQLADIAQVRIAEQMSVLHRRNQSPTVTISVRHPGMTAEQITARLQEEMEQINLPSGYTLELGGEIEASEEANSSLIAFFPIALLGMAGLFLWQFGSLRKMAIVMASIPFVVIGGTLGLAITGLPMNFTATLGFLALAGIIVNNAVLLLERVAEEKSHGASDFEAVVKAAEVRLRPIVMTKLVCIVGLMPLFAFGGALWQPMAAVMIGGLALGTLITLALIPALYALFFGVVRPEAHSDDANTTHKLEAFQ
jgi:multidrug efflux pump